MAANPGVLGARVEIVHQQPHVHAAIGGLQHLLRQEQTRGVGVPDVGLHVEAARRELRAVRANDEGFRALDHQSKAGFAGMFRLGGGQRAVERRMSTPGSCALTAGRPRMFGQLCAGRAAAGRNDCGRPAPAAFQDFIGRRAPQGAGSNSMVPPSAMSERYSRPSLTTYERTYGHWRTSSSCREPTGHIARVSASGPNSTLPGPEDFQLPRPRLQSKRTLSTPLVPNPMV